MISRPFAYNTGATIDYTTQLGNLAISDGTIIDWNANGVDWYMGPDEDLGYVIAYTADTQPTPTSGTAKIQFWRSPAVSQSSFVGLADYISNKVGNPQNFADGIEANTWLTDNLFWNSWVSCLLVGDFNDVVYTIAIQPSAAGTKMLIGGLFTLYTPPSSTEVNRYYLAQLNYNGTLTSLEPSINSQVNKVIVQPDGKILVGGLFSQVNSSPWEHIVRLNPEGSIDSTFAGGGGNGSGFDNGVYTIALQDDGKILVGGSFSTYSGQGANFFVRLKSDGYIDESFNNGGFDGRVETIAVQDDGKILVGGAFTEYSGASALYIIRLESDGNRDLTFPGYTNDVVNTIYIKNDNEIFLGGNFTTYTGTSSPKIVKIDNNGAIDTGFSVGDGFTGGDKQKVNVIEVQPDGKVLVGGDFADYRGTMSKNIARIDSNGSLDTSFITGDGFDEQVYDIKLFGNGQILVGGAFTAYNSQSVNRLIRLNNDGGICDG